MNNIYELLSAFFKQNLASHRVLVVRGNITESQTKQSNIIIGIPDSIVWNYRPTNITMEIKLSPDVPVSIIFDIFNLFKGYVLPVIGDTQIHLLNSETTILGTDPSGNTFYEIDAVVTFSPLNTKEK